MRHETTRNMRSAAVAVMGAVVMGGGFSGCAAMHSDAATRPLASAAPATVQPTVEQATFETPDAAVAGLLAAVQANDHDQLRKLFGALGKDLASGDPVADANSYKTFAQQILEKAQLEERSPTVAVLHIGVNDWPFPIPISKAATGRWYFDTAAGQNEILARRIGANELETISMCRAYIEAQKEYAGEDRDGSDVLKYAQYFRSHSGKKDGLYWDAKAGEPQSPFGVVVAGATMEGYLQNTAGTGPHPFHGYYYHMLTKQGASAPGGKYNYVINGNMIAGFAMIAYPDSYGKSGVMTFVVSHHGKVFQKDLGSRTLEIARGMTAYDPDSSWAVVK